MHSTNVKKEEEAEPFFAQHFVDPRDCMYRLKPSIRKRVDNVIEKSKSTFGDIVDDKPIEIKGRLNIKHRKKAKVEEESKIEVEEKSKDEEDKKLARMKLSKLEEILARGEKEKEESYSYEDMSKMFQFLQYLDKDFANMFFYNFLEDNSRLTYMPPKRNNELLEQNLRKLKMRVALTDYEQMQQSVGRTINIGKKQIGVGPGTGTFSRSTLAEEMRNIRGILFHTAESKLAIVGTFFALYFGLHFLVPSISIAQRILFSFIFTFPVIVADVYNLFKLV